MNWNITYVQNSAQKSKCIHQWIFIKQTHLNNRNLTGDPLWPSSLLPLLKGHMVLNSQTWRRCILPGLHNKWHQIVLSVLYYICEIRPYCWVYLWLNHCRRWRILHSVTVPQFIYILYWRWYLGCFYFGAINNRLPGIFLSLPDVFLKPGAGLPSLQEDCPLQWFTTFCLVSLHLLPLTWDAWHSFFFFL